jgi:hypothetical protein
MQICSYKNVMGQKEYQPDHLKSKFNMSTAKVHKFLNDIFLEQQTNNHLDSYSIYKSSFQSFYQCQQTQSLYFLDPTLIFINIYSQNKARKAVLLWLFFWPAFWKKFRT